MIADIEIKPATEYQTIEYTPPVCVSTLKEAEIAFFNRARIVLCFGGSLYDGTSSHCWVSNYEEAMSFYTYCVVDETKKDELDLYTASGADLDKIAMRYYFMRAPGETDAEVRHRLICISNLIDTFNKSINEASAPQPKKEIDYLAITRGVSS